MLLRFALAILSGVLFALAFPNVAQGWLSFFAFTPLVIAIVRAKGSWESFFLGWIGQTTAWLLMVPWVIRVMSRFGGLPVFTGVLLYIAMSAILGLYGGLFAVLVRRMRLGLRFLPWLMVPLAWAIAEYARTYLLSGYPWNLLATAIVDYAPLIQIDRFAGPYFVGALIVFPSTVIAWWITQKPAQIARVLVVGSLGILLLVWWGTGLVASKLNARPNGTPAITAALLQPNISQEMRWDNQQVIAIYGKMMEMTERAAQNGAKVVIWPESTVPLSYTETAFYRDSIEELSKRRNIDIILGSVATDPTKTPQRLWNSAFLVSNGVTIGHYDKIRLVPFGEYVPLRRVLFFAEKMVRAVGEFEFGTNETPLTGQLTYGPAICYEIVFPQISRSQIRNGADVLVTITNDAWFEGSAPMQHLQQARLRAVEGDRFVLRSATTGISAYIDPTGRVLESIPMNGDGIIYAKFQPRTTITPYVRFGDWFAWAAMVVVLLGILYARRHATSN